MPTNFYMYFVVALIPLVIGAIYYNPKVMGNAWMKANKFTAEDLKGANMAVVFGLTYLFGLFITFMLGGIVIHQSAVFQMMMPEVAESGSAAQGQFNELMMQYGDNFRTFKHGALHGFIFTIGIVLPIIAINSLFERRGWKYIMIHTGYWLICLTIMGGILCQSLQYELLS